MILRFNDDFTFALFEKGHTVSVNVLTDEEEAVVVEHVVVEVDSADATAEEAVDSAAAQTETAVSVTIILRTGSPGSVYVNHDGI